MDISRDSVILGCMVNWLRVFKLVFCTTVAEMYGDINMSGSKLQLLALWTQNLMVERINTVAGCNTFSHTVLKVTAVQVYKVTLIKTVSP